ncbi:MAG: type IX secretion system membrane protein PorP/SprF [Bacteroidota bacterium]
MKQFIIYNSALFHSCGDHKYRRDLICRKLCLTFYFLLLIPIIIVTLCSTFSYTYAQQLPHHSQYMFNDYFINPAVAGSKDYNPAMLTFRNQWIGIDDAPITQTLSVHGSWSEKVGIGGIIINDRTGPVHQTGLQLSYAYHLSVSNEAKLSLGLAGMFYQHVIDKAEITLDEPNDNAILGGVEKKYIPEASFGAYFYSKKYYVGFSVPQLFQHKVDYDKDDDLNFNKLVRHYFLTAGYYLKINEDLHAEPSFLFKVVAHTPIQFDINAKVIYKETVWLGTSYRNKESIVIMLGAKKNNFSLGYSYDITLTNIKKYSSGSHELFIGMNIPSFKSSNSPSFE